MHKAGAVPDPWGREGVLASGPENWEGEEFRGPCVVEREGAVAVLVEDASELVQRKAEEPQAGEEPGSQCSLPCRVHCDATAVESGPRVGNSSFGASGIGSGGKHGMKRRRGDRSTFLILTLLRLQVVVE